ncbi:MAG: UPF0280 family protein [Rhodospirillaceae bacterium]|nr:UPF0280 family protein [Rhodospirillaceae bacterium]MBT5082486.1 UPF0280 family protein [Rhodospirillaceae bacterium]MBT6985696.1 UPF0280 family protein [Rhodospirillaceae bacterium]MBT7285626.1 UPF0280 family protein [Rhodospirillaceae bacterium]MBT7667700.1 UPF0280 family protein [Rhodospirillaceae bacterium]
MGPQASRDEYGRLLLQHGPIDLIVEMYGDGVEVEKAYGQAQGFFQDVLDGLVGELAQLRRPVTAAYPMFQGKIAQRMARAVWPLRHDYITPMAAVAGAVADEVLAAAVRDRDLEKGYINNGGDIAVYLSPGSHLDAGVVADLPHGALSGGLSGKVRLAHDMGIRGIATSGWQGRSHSLGIADAVTVLAATAAQADAAATMIANRVNIDDPCIDRAAANSLDPDCDLGDRAVTVAVGELSEGARRSALLSGLDHARGLLAGGIIHGAMLSLGDQVATTGVTTMDDLDSREFLS